MYKSGEIHEVMADFEKIATGRFEKESIELWKKGQWYQSGEVNSLFAMFLHGWSAWKCWERLN